MGQRQPEILHGLTRASGAARAESLSTLKFAQRAKAVRNVARVNEDLDQRTLLRRYEGELRRLRAELQQRQRDVVDKRQLLQACLFTVRTICCSLYVFMLTCIWYDFVSSEVSKKAAPARKVYQAGCERLSTCAFASA
jgi:hypothetical protein